MLQFGMTTLFFINNFECRFTGRGLMTTRAIRAGDTVISLSKIALITTDTVLESTTGHFVKRSDPKLTAHEVLSVFLMHERHLGSSSYWHPYINVLPKSFATPPYLSESDFNFLPKPVLRQTERHLQSFYTSYNRIKTFSRQFWPEMEAVFTKAGFMWSWYCVNTRSVYVKMCDCAYLAPGENCYALAPVLDLLNHSATAQVKAGINEGGSHFEITTMDSYQPYDQVFICYGAHDNTKLFLEYGFTLPRNPNNVYQFTPGDIKLLVTEFNINQLSQKNEVLEKIKLFKDLTCNEEGFSWKMMTMLRILAMTWEELQHWKTALHGEPVSDYNEALVKTMAIRLLQKALDENLETLQVEENLNTHQKLAFSLRHDDRSILQTNLQLLTGDY